MKNYFYYDTCGKLREIFRQHCNLSCEQYEVIRGEFIFLVCDFQEGETQAEIEKRMNRMRVIFDFLYETKELTMAELNALNEMVSDIWQKAMDHLCETILKEGARV